MANAIPLSGLTDAAGGILLPEAQGGILTNGVLESVGAFALAGDSRAVSTRREAFQIWKGTPTASFVGEGGTKPVTGAEFGGGTLNVKKVATIVVFTDEQIEDMMNGDMNVLVDGGVRTAIAQKIDANAIGLEAGSNITSNFDAALRQTTSKVEYNASTADGYQLAVSAAMGTLEANGYTNLGALIPADVGRLVRDARVTTVGAGTATAQALYQQTNDPLYGLPRQVSTNLSPVTSAAGTANIVGFVVNRDNLHVRIRRDVYVTPSRDASLDLTGSGTLTSLYQNDLSAARYVTRVGFWIHDINRAVVAITNAS